MQFLIGLVLDYDFVFTAIVASNATLESDHVVENFQAIIKYGIQLHQGVYGYTKFVKEVFKNLGLIGWY